MSSEIQPAIGAESGDLWELSGLSDELFTKPLVETLKTVLHRLG